MFDPQKRHLMFCFAYQICEMLFCQTCVEGGQQKSGEGLCAGPQRFCSSVGKHDVWSLSFAYLYGCTRE